MNEEFAELLLLLAEQSIATSDVLTIICLHLANQDQQAAALTAQTLETICEGPETEKTQSFLALAGRVSQALRSDPLTPLLGVLKSDAFLSSQQELRSLLTKLRGS